MTGIIYHLFNVENGKSYVGQTWDTLENRWKQHCRGDGKIVISRAIGKYGRESFVRTTLIQCNNQSDLDVAEDAFILELGTFHPNGYNMRLGGSHGRHSEASRRKMSESHKGKKPPPTSAFGEIGRKAVVEKSRHLKRTDETRNKMRMAKLGVPRSEEAKKAVSDGMKAANLGPSRVGKKRNPYGPRKQKR